MSRCPSMRVTFFLLNAKCSWKTTARTWKTGGANDTGCIDCRFVMILWAAHSRIFSWNKSKKSRWRENIHYVNKNYSYTCVWYILYILFPHVDFWRLNISTHIFIVLPQIEYKTLEIIRYLDMAQYYVKIFSFSALSYVSAVGQSR